MGLFPAVAVASGETCGDMMGSIVQSWGHLTLMQATWGGAALFLVLGLSACATAIAFKWLFFARMQEAEHDFTSTYMLRWMTFNFSIIPLVSRFFTKFLRGSPFFLDFLRANGAKVGKQVFYYGVLEAAADFDMLDIGDNAVVEYNVRLQAHEV